MMSLSVTAAHEALCRLKAQEQQQPRAHLVGQLCGSCRMVEPYGDQIVEMFA